jgi:hypothetical protein
LLDPVLNLCIQFSWIAILCVSMGWPIITPDRAGPFQPTAPWPEITGRMSHGHNLHTGFNRQQRAAQAILLHLTTAARVPSRKITDPPASADVACLERSPVYRGAARRAIDVDGLHDAQCPAYQWNHMSSCLSTQHCRKHHSLRNGFPGRCMFPHCHMTSLRNVLAFHHEIQTTQYTQATTGSILPSCVQSPSAH